MTGAFLTTNTCLFYDGNSNNTSLDYILFGQLTIYLEIYIVKFVSWRIKTRG